MNDHKRIGEFCFSKIFNVFQSTTVDALLADTLISRRTALLMATLTKPQVSVEGQLQL